MSSEDLKKTNAALKARKKKLKRINVELKPKARKNLNRLRIELEVPQAEALELLLLGNSEARSAFDKIIAGA